MSPTQMTLKLLRRLGWTAEVVEKWVSIKREGEPDSGFRKDFLGCIDILAVKPQEGIVGVQATSPSNLSARVTKAKAQPGLRVWLKSGGRFQVWVFRKVHGKYEPKIVELRGEDLTEDVICAPPRKRGGRKIESGSLF